MNDPFSTLRERLHHARRSPQSHTGPETHAAEALQLLTAKLLLFTGVGTLLEALQHTGAPGRSGAPAPAGAHGSESGPRPSAWAPAVLGGAAAVAHAVRAFSSTERTRLATRTFDVAVVAVGLLAVAETLANARRDGELPDVAPVSLASAGLLGILIDRTDSQHHQELRRLARRASIVERLVPRRRPRLDRIVVHV